MGYKAPQRTSVMNQELRIRPLFLKPSIAIIIWTKTPRVVSVVRPAELHIRGLCKIIDATTGAPHRVFEALLGWGAEASRFYWLQH